MALDTESDTIDACGTKDVSEASQAFIDVCKATGYKTGFYVSHHLYKRYGLNKVKADFLWLPRFGKDTGKPEVKPDWPCDLWQYSQQCKVEWYPYELDLNLLNGNKKLDWFIGNQKVEVKEKEVKKVSPAPKKKVKSSSYGVYTIQRGDALSVLAKKFKTTIQRLQDLNGIPDPNKIYRGQSLSMT